MKVSHAERQNNSRRQQQWQAARQAQPKRFRQRHLDAAIRRALKATHESRQSSGAGIWNRRALAGGNSHLALIHCFNQFRRGVLGDGLGVAVGFVATKARLVSSNFSSFSLWNFG